MTTAYTSLLGLALPVTGELSGTWGDTVNNSITSLLDSAIAGTTTLSSDADVTLTTTTGASNTSRQAILLWTAGGTVTRNITAPAQSKIYTVINKSSSTQSIVLRGVGPTTGVTIVKGESAVCAWNGSDFIKISNTGGAAVFTTLDVTNLEVTNIKALDGTSAASIANSTGVISLTANPILSGGTANGVAYLNGSKALTTGSALVFDGTNLGVGAAPTTSWPAGRPVIEINGTTTGNLAFNGNNTNGYQIWMNSYYNGSVSVYKYNGFANNCGGGGDGSFFWNLAASGTAGNTITFTQAMTLDASGNLGIGTSSPGTKLDVRGTINASDGTNGNIRAYVDGTAAYLQSLNQAANAYRPLLLMGSTVLFANNGVTNATLDTSGNLGLGVTPSAWSWRALQVGSFGGFFATNTGAYASYLGNNAYYNAGWKYIASTAAVHYEMAGGDGAHRWYNAPSGTAGNAISFTQAMTLDASGNLGIGATSISSLGSGYQTTQLQGTNGSGIRFYYGASTSLGYINADSTGLSIGTVSSTPLMMITGNAERARIDSSGNLLVGTTSKFAGGIDGLDLNTTGETGITFGKSGVVKNYFYLITNESAFQWQTVSGVAVNIISSTNGVTLANGGTSWGSLSDERKKDIIEPITDATTKVSGLRAVIGKYKTEEDGIRRAMLIAQDVQAVLPEAVTENADGDLILQYTDTIPLLVAAIKEQTALITTLTARITALESA